MTTKDEKEEWHRLCELIAKEPDPRRLSELVEQLIKLMDSRRQELQKPAAASAATE
jgi:hypothetical protein